MTDKPVDKPMPRPMPVTVVVKEELARAPAGRVCCRRAEIATVLRVADAVTLEAGGRVVITAVLDTAAAALRLRAGIEEVFGVHAATAVLAPPPAAPRRGYRWAVRVPTAAASLARRGGLLDEAGVLVRGLPPPVVTGPTCHAEAIWRAAVLAGGSLSEPGKGATLTITLPGGEQPALSLALTGAARRLHAPTTVRQVRGVEQILINDRAALTALLARLGAPTAARTWAEHAQRAQQERAAAAATRTPPFSEANSTRSAVAARTAAAQLARALDILDSDAPPHLGAAARARIAHPEATLEQLGARHDPPLSKDTIAGRIRRLLALADTRAAERGIPAATSATADPR